MQNRCVYELARFVASGCWSGLSPKAPGTFGTVAAVAAWLYIHHFHPGSIAASPLWLPLITFCVGLLATQLCLYAEPEGTPAKDPQYVVIDEWAGVFIALGSASPDNAMHVAWGFVLFRFFDILKPGPVRLLEKLPGALGVMMDDIAAGLLALLSFKLYFTLFGT